MLPQRKHNFVVAVGPILPTTLYIARHRPYLIHT